MTINRLLVSITLPALFVSVAMAQASGTTQATGQTGQAGAAVPAAPPKLQDKASKEEQNAYAALEKVYKNPATTSDGLDAAITAFLGQFPGGPLSSSAQTLGLEFNADPAHKDYNKALQYGTQAVKDDPKNIVALTKLSEAMSFNIQNADMDRDQRVAEARAYCTTLLALMDDPDETYNGHKLSGDQKTTFKAEAYGSEARLDMAVEKFPDAVSDYKKAIAIEDPDSQAADYYYMAVAQFNMKAFSDANSSLDKAAALGKGNDVLLQTIDGERKAIKDAQAH